MSLPSSKISSGCGDYKIEYNYHDREGQTHNPVEFEVFSDEIVLEIFSHLKLDLPALALVSRDFQRLADDHVLYEAWYPAVAVGVKKLHEYLPDDPKQEIEKEGRLPRRVHKDLAEGEYIEDGEEKQKYMLTWIDEKFSGKSLALLYMHELVSNAKKGTKTGFDFQHIWKKVIKAERTIEKPHWCLHPKGNIPDSMCSSRVKKLAIIEEQRIGIPGLYLQSGRDTVFSVFMNRVITGEMCFPTGVYTMVSEQIEVIVNEKTKATLVYSIVFGGFSDDGLVITHHDESFRDGVAGARKSFGA